MAKQYREVKRKAEVGERIRIVDALGSEGMYENNDVFTVDAAADFGVFVGAVATSYSSNDLGYIADEEYVVLKEIADITVRPDPKLGGVLREYTQEKRKANVGETIIIVNATYGFGYSNGQAHIVRKVHALPGVDVPYIWSDGTEDSAIYLNDDEYEVLTPTDVILVDGKRFRMVERKAAVGERVIVTGSGNCETDGTLFCHKVGEVGEVEERLEADANGAGRISVRRRYLVDGDYAVLEQIPETSVDYYEDTSAPTPQEDAISSLTVRLARAKQRIDALTAEVNAKKAESCGCAKIAEGNVTTAFPSFLSPQEIRDNTVKRAIADVAKITTDVYGEKEPGAFEKYKTPGHVTIEFVVNPEKKTVAAIVRLRYYPDTVNRRGIAKCAPGDVFNAHIGKAIALRRALGLEVPQEYVTCPQPTDVCVGDIVTWSREFAHYRVLALESTRKTPVNLRGVWLRGRVSEWNAQAGTLVGAEILDDTARYDSEVSVE